MLAKKALAATAVSAPAVEGTYVEDVFSTYLYTGNGTSQTINNGIALANGAANGTILHLRADAASGGTNNTFLDSSTNNYTVYRNGDVAQGAFSPFNGTGGSAYFDGTGDYLYTSGPNLVVGTGAFTLEWWIYLPAAPSGWTGTVNIGDGIWMGSGRLTPLLAGNAAYLRTSLGANYTDYYFNNSPIRVGQWNHIAIQRETSGTVLAYCNGYVATSGSLAGSGVNLTIDEITVGNSDQGNLTGYISNVRLTRGSALYGSTYTVPTAPLTGGSLLLNFTNANIVDSAPIPSNIELEGNTQISNSVYKYGTGSIYFDGSGDRLVIPPQPKLDLNGDFTIEMWVYPTNISSYHVLFDTSSTGTAGADMTELWINPSGTVAYYARGSVLFTSTTALSTNTWYHVALTKQNSTQRLFINGVLEGTATSSTQPNTSYYWYIGDRQASAGSGQYPFQGYIDDLRITKGTARYTSNFTPPAAALPLDTLVESDGGMVWIKQRSQAIDHILADTLRKTTKYLNSNTTTAEQTFSGSVTAFNSTGFSVGNGNAVNESNQTFASWTFRKAEKFFDVVTYTGNGASSQTISHNLGSTPGCIMVKRLDTTGAWRTYHRGLSSPTTTYVTLNETSGATNGDIFPSSPTSTTFTVGSGSNFPAVNANGGSFVAYLFAHNAGGFGDAGDQNVISCGSFTASSGLAVNLGYEPQFVILKASSTNSNWLIMDNMRGMPVGDNEPLLRPNTSDAETNTLNIIDPTQTGFTVIDGGGLVMGAAYIYIAIRRGPMKTPTSGTEVFAPVAVNYATTMTVTTGFPVDLVISAQRSSLEVPWRPWRDRLRGNAVILRSDTSASESSSYGTPQYDQTKIVDQYFSTAGSTSGSHIYWNFRRAPGFFEQVLYTGTGSTRTVGHNLGVAPELIITKARNVTGDWAVYAAPRGAGNWLRLNTTGAAASTTTVWANTAPTASQFSVGTSTAANSSGVLYTAYLFASCPGVSKIGTVSITGAAINVDCGFTSGARLVLVKRTSSTSPWLIWDSARGIVAANDPYMYINSTFPENYDGAADFIDPLSSGFTIAAGGIDGVWGAGDYLYLAIA